MLSEMLSSSAQIFLNSLESFQGMVSKYGFQVRTHSEKSLQRFLGLEKHTQAEIIKGFTSYLSFLTKFQMDGLDLREDSLLLKTFLQQMGFIYDKGLSDQISPGDVIEVYTADQIQIFRNLVFMDLCNYTLLDLLTHDPYELYERSDLIKKELNQAVTTLSGRPMNTEPLDMSHIPKHILREKFSDQRLSSMVEFKCLSPLYTWPPKELAGFVAIQRGHNILEQGTSNELCFL